MLAPSILYCSRVVFGLTQLVKVHRIISNLVDKRKKDAPAECHFVRPPGLNPVVKMRISAPGREAPNE
jgi:hypothetical protein